MTEVVQRELTNEMKSFLQGEKLIFLSTVDHEKGIPNMTCISWLVANTSTEISFAIDPRSRVLDNLDRNATCNLTFIGLGSCYSVTGKASSNREQLDNVSIKMTQVSVAVEEVRDVLFYGGKISEEPNYVKTYDAELAKKLDTAVYAALRKE
jgi:predicted pyridoxine 5'-phosphate oxidase superfamily flavin-nucleotide-binding protein